MFGWINSSLTRRVKPPTQPVPEPDPFHRRNLDGEILELEFQCESDASSEQLIAKLTTLYTLAVGHFESVGNSRYKIYQRRLQNFLKKRNIDQVLRGKSASLACRKDLTEKEVIGARIKSRGEAAQILERSQRLERMNMAKLCSNLTEQEQQLSRRIHKRRAMSTCSSRTKDEDDEEELRPLAELVLSSRIEKQGFSITDIKGKRVFI